jgi:hypothetical protein
MHHCGGRVGSLLHAYIAQKKHGHRLTAGSTRPLPGCIGRRETGTGAKQSYPEFVHEQILPHAAKAIHSGDVVDHLKEKPLE